MNNNTFAISTQKDYVWKVTTIDDLVTKTHQLWNMMIRSSKKHNSGLITLLQLIVMYSHTKLELHTVKTWDMFIIIQTHHQQVMHFKRHFMDGNILSFFLSWCGFKLQEQMKTLLYWSYFKAKLRQQMIEFQVLI